VQPPEPAAPGHTPVYEAALRLWSDTLHADALTLLEAEAGRDPLAAPLHYLQGLILVDLARPEEALAAFRRCTCADPAFVAGHLAQAGLFARAGLQERARTALRNTVHLVADRPLGDLVLEREGLTVGDVLDVVGTQRSLIGPRPRPEQRRAHGA
jgi:tetratricopeptide (TPR) repeat protein